jgi:hypothetical protein
MMVVACSGDKDSGGPAADAPWRPELVCPGDAGCESLGDGQLHAGAAARAITPECYETWDDLDEDGEYSSSDEPFYDCGCDRLCDGDDGYPGPDDGEEDGVFQAIYMAGFGTNRPMRGVHDDIWARAVVVEQGDVTIALVSLDLIGVFYDDVRAVREAIAAQAAVDLVVLSATHGHEGPDSLGQWGRQIGQTGYNTDYMAHVIDTTAEAVVEAVGSLQPASLRVGRVNVADFDAEKGSRNVVHDHRDPKIIEPYLNTARLIGDDGASIATVVNYANHPEALAADNTLVSSDFADALRRGVEDGVDWSERSVDGLGGVCVYVQGAVGGMMSPLRVEVTDGDGDRFSAAGFEKSDALGSVLAEMALEADATGKVVDAPSLALRTATLQLPIDNILFQAAFLMGMLDRPIYNIDSGETLDFADGRPEVLTEIDVIDLGPIRMLTVPGELLPELALGGYDGSSGQPFTPLEDIIDSENPNPPDLSAAPSAPYLYDRMAGEYNWIIGLGNDEVGYIIPPYNFQLHESTPYLQDADGDHYEETNSLGPETAPLIEDAVTRLLEWSP